MPGDILALTQSSPPLTPAAGRTRLYSRTDGRWYSQDSAGTEYLVSGDEFPSAARLQAAPSAGATSITLNIPLHVLGSNLGWLIIDPYTLECEVREVTSISASGKVVGIPALTYAHAAQDAVLWTADPVYDVRLFGATGDGSTDDRAAIMAAIANAGSNSTITFPAREYVIESMTGVGTPQVASILINNVENITIIGMQGAALRFKNGSSNRPFIVRDVAGLDISGLEFIYDRADHASTDGLCLQTVSDADIHDLYIHGFPHYGLVVSERTDNWGYRSAVGLSFDAASHRITDASGGITGLSVGNSFFVTGSTLNDSKYTVTALDTVNHTWVQVTETLVNEAALAFKNLLIDDDISFNATSRTLVNDGANGFASLAEGMLIEVIGSTLNDGVYTISDLASALHDVVQVEEPVVTEAAGAMITIRTGAKPSLSQLLAGPCDNMRIYKNRIEHIGGIGIEVFPKIKSVNLAITDNFVYDCGLPSRIGAGIKVGQGYINSICTTNVCDECMTGISGGSGDVGIISNNIITNFHAFGIAATLGVHPRLPSVSTIDAVYITGNELSHTTKRGTITQANPRGTPFTTTEHMWGGINLNGLSETDITDPANPIPITQYRDFIVEGNTIVNVPGGALTINISRTRMQNIKYLRNTIVDCNLAINIVPMAGWGTVVNGSNVVTDVKQWKAGQLAVDATETTAGWYAKSGIVASFWEDSGATANDDILISMPEGTTVISIDPATRTFTLSNPVSVINRTTLAVIPEPQVDITLNSDFPEEMEIIGNVVSNTFRANNTGVIPHANFRVYGTRARIIGNTIENSSTYPFQVRGDGTLIANNTIYGHYGSYQVGDATTNAIFLFDRAGTYTVRGNHVQSKKSTAPNITAWCNNNGAQNPGLSSVVFVKIDSSNTASTALNPKPLVALQPTALHRAGILKASVTWDPGSIAAGGNATLLVTVEGATPGNQARAALTSATGTQWNCVAHVTTGQTVWVMLVNHSAGAIDLASGTLNVEVSQL